MPYRLQRMKLTGKSSTWQDIMTGAHSKQECADHLVDLLDRVSNLAYSYRIVAYSRHGDTAVFNNVIKYTDAFNRTGK